MNSKLSNSMIVVLLLCPLVPGTGRFAYGLYLAIALFFILFFAVTSRFLVLKSGFKETEHYVTLLFVISGAVIFNKVMSFFIVNSSHAYSIAYNYFKYHIKDKIFEHYLLFSNV